MQKCKYKRLQTIATPIHLNYTKYHKEKKTVHSLIFKYIVSTGDVMKKLFIISSLLIFIFGCSANTYSTLKVYPCDAEIFAYITQADDNSYISILYLSDGIDFQLDNEEEYLKGIYDIVDEGDANARDTSLIPDALQTAVKKYRSCCSTLYIKGSDQQLNELQNFLETFNFHIVVIGNTSFDILGRIDKKVVVLPIQKI